MKVAELETLILAQDIHDRAQLYCLACRRRLAGVSLTDRYGEDGELEASLSISLLSEDLRDFHQNPGSVTLTCGCNIKSTYYLI